MKIIIMPGVNKADISGGYWNRLELGAGLPTEIPADHPRLQAAVDYFDALFPQLVDAVLAVNPAIGQIDFPANLILRTKDGPISDVVDATQAVLWPDQSAVDVYGYIYGKRPTVPLQTFEAWYVATHPPPPPAPSPSGLAIVGDRMDDMTEIFGAPTFAFRGDNRSYDAGDTLTEGGRTYETKTLGHPMGVRKFLVLKS